MYILRAFYIRYFIYIAHKRIEMLLYNLIYDDILENPR